MAAVQQRVLNWLYSVLTLEYQDINRTYSDVAQTLSHYSSLSPKTEVFTYEHGESALLLNLSGTIPVNFRGTTYRFPISLWIPHAYPRQAPLAYVTPAEGMVIRAGQHVDPQGKVYHPYLVAYSDNSNLVDFLGILREVFAREPPVVARQTRSVQQPRPGPQSMASPPPPPLPAKNTSGGTQIGSPDMRPPPPPPKPFAGPASAASPSPMLADNRSSGPPLPPLPSGGARAPQPFHSPTPLQAAQQSQPRYASPPAQRPTQIMPNGSLQYTPMMHHYPPHYGEPSIPATAYAATPGPYSNSVYPGGPPNSIVGNYSQQPLNQPKAKPPPPPDLLDEPLTLPAPESMPLVAPPIPPNPEKDMLLHSLAQALHSQRQHSHTQTSSSLPGLRAQKSSMLASLSAMNQEIHALESLSALLASNTTILHTSLREADTVISSSQGRTPPAIDEILVAPTVVGNQLYDIVSEERSLGDALFVLSRAVERGRVSASVFVKTTRTLAREWYLKKALVKKIAKGMGLVTTQASYGR